MIATRRIVAACVASAFIALPASAGLVTLTMQNGDDGGMPFNTTAFVITNISAPGVNLMTWSMNVGDTAFYYDQLYADREQFLGGDGTQTALLTVGDRFNGETNPTDEFAYSFSNFAAGVGFRGQWDIDPDAGGFDVDARTILFNNGAAPNAVAVFTFSDGSSVEYTLPDLPVLDSYTLTIPGPGTAGVMLLGVLAIARRRRN